MRPSKDSETETPWPSPALGWLAVVFLMLASMVSQFDRTVINLMVEPLKEAFAIGDTMFGMLQGIAFGIFYILACFPIGRLADRYQRRLVIGIGVAFFSLFAMASGLARSYAQLFLMRIGVGIGEASVTPAGLSLLSDYFPPDRLGKPVGAFLMSAPIGMGLAYIGGGTLLQWLTTSPILETGLFSGFEPWQAAFIIIGFPGLLLVPLFLFLREPVRRGPGGNEPLSLREVMAIILERRKALVPMLAGFCMVKLVSYAYFVWSPALLHRSYDWNSAQIGIAFGLILLIFGTGGAYFGGWMSDRLSQRGHLDAPLKVAAFGFVGCGIFGLLAPLMPTAWAALTLLAPAIFLSNTPYACIDAGFQIIVPNRVRAQVTAISITVTTLVGLAIGPMIVGLMTDYVFKDPADIKYSLAIIVALPAPIMFVLMMYAMGPFRSLREAALDSETDVRADDQANDGKA